MHRRVLTVLAVLLVAALTIQTAEAARRKPARASATQQHRDTTPAALASSGTRSCDIFWCYQN